jgi:glutamate---cysteine ligase / carboxylate-amine ligase
MLLDPSTLDLAPVADQVVERLGDDPRFKLELPAAQIELITEPCADVVEAAKALAAGRSALQDACEGIARPAGAGTHPFARAPAQLSSHPRYEPTRREYGPIAARQLVFGLHVHVRLAGEQRALAVYNALRSYLPLLAALGANSPYYEGRDSGMASVRPKLSELLPRQGVPPPLSSLDEMVAAIEWGLRSGALPTVGAWWWELRLHPVLATIEVRVPDQPARMSQSVALAAVVHCLVAWLAARHDGGERLPVHPTWRIEENRWSAARHGMEGTMSDLDTGERRPTAERVAELLDAVEPHAAGLGAQDALSGARELARENGAQRTRRLASEGDAVGVCRWLAREFSAG